MASAGQCRSPEGGGRDGTFQAAVSFAAGDLPLSVAVADLGGVTANESSDDVSVLLNLFDPAARPEIVHRRNTLRNRRVPH